MYFDWLTWLELAKHNEVVCLDSIVGYYRRHDQATTLNANINLYLGDYKNLDLVLHEFSNQYEKKDLIYAARKKLVKRYMRKTLRNDLKNIGDIVFFIRKYFQIIN